MRAFLLIMPLALLCAAPTMAAKATIIPPGYFIDTAQAGAKRPADRVLADGDFTLSIHRHCDGPLGARLLGIAEATYPPRERLIDRAIEMQSEIGPDSSRTPLWWCDGAGVGRLPYAITAGALTYYTKLIERLRAHTFREASAQNLLWTDLAYRASITPRDHYYLGDSLIANVYIAEMSLSWSFDDGIFAPTAMAHRMVVLTRDGTVLAVEGDGGTQTGVSMSSQRRPDR